MQCFQPFGASAELCALTGQNRLIHHAHERIIIQQEFIQIPNVVVKAVARSGQIQLHEIVEGCTEALRKMRLDRFVIGFALRKLRSIEQRRQERKRGSIPRRRHPTWSEIHPARRVPGSLQALLL